MLILNRIESLFKVLGDMRRPGIYAPALVVIASVLFMLSACQFPAQTAVPVPPTQIAPAAAPPTTEPLQPAIEPTALPTLPPPETAVPPSTPIYNPALAEWTVLVYMDGDNNLELSALRDLNEMEAAGGSERVNVVVQVDRALGETTVDGDWTGGRRYLMRGDADADLMASELLEEMGEINMGDPQTLADFVAWGMQTYPANRTALVMWDHGAGWNGISFDSDTAIGAR